MAGQMEVTNLVVQLHSNIDSIHACIKTLSDTSSHDAELDRLAAERETKIAELRNAHQDALAQLAAQRQQEQATLEEQRRKEQDELEEQRRREYEELMARRKREDEEREKKVKEEDDIRERVKKEEDERREGEREEREKELAEAIERELERLEDEMEAKVEEGKRALRDLDEKRKAINAEIEKALNAPTVIPTIQFRSRAKTLSRATKAKESSAPKEIVTDEKPSADDPVKVPSSVLVGAASTGGKPVDGTRDMPYVLEKEVDEMECSPNPDPAPVETQQISAAAIDKTKDKSDDLPTNPEEKVDESAFVEKAAATSNKDASLDLESPPAETAPSPSEPVNLDAKELSPVLEKHPRGTSLLNDDQSGEKTVPQDNDKSLDLTSDADQPSKDKSLEELAETEQHLKEIPSVDRQNDLSESESKSTENSPPHHHELSVVNNSENLASKIEETLSIKGTLSDETLDLLDASREDSREALSDSPAGDSEQSQNLLPEAHDQDGIAPTETRPVSHETEVDCWPEGMKTPSREEQSEDSKNASEIENEPVLVASLDAQPGADDKVLTSGRALTQGEAFNIDKENSGNRPRSASLGEGDVQEGISDGKTFPASPSIHEHVAADEMPLPDKQESSARNDDIEPKPEDLIADTAESHSSESNENITESQNDGSKSSDPLEAEHSTEATGMTILESDDQHDSSSGDKNQVPEVVKEPESDFKPDFGGEESNTNDEDVSTDVVHDNISRTPISSADVDDMAGAEAGDEIVKPEHQPSPHDVDDASPQTDLAGTQHPVFSPELRPEPSVSTQENDTLPSEHVEPKCSIEDLGVKECEPELISQNEDQDSPGDTGAQTQEHVSAPETGGDMGSEPKQAETRSRATSVESEEDLFALNANRVRASKSIEDLYPELQIMNLDVSAAESGAVANRGTAGGPEMGEEFDDQKDRISHPVESESSEDAKLAQKELEISDFKDESMKTNTHSIESDPLQNKVKESAPEKDIKADGVISPEASVHHDTDDLPSAIEHKAYLDLSSDLDTAQCESDDLHSETDDNVPGNNSVCSSGPGFDAPKEMQEPEGSIDSACKDLSGVDEQDPETSAIVDPSLIHSSESSADVEVETSPVIQKGDILIEVEHNPEVAQEQRESHEQAVTSDLSSPKNSEVAGKGVVLDSMSQTHPKEQDNAPTQYSSANDEDDLSIKADSSAPTKQKKTLHLDLESEPRLTKETSEVESVPVTPFPITPIPSSDALISNELASQYDMLPGGGTPHRHNFEDQVGQPSAGPTAEAEARNDENHMVVESLTETGHQERDVPAAAHTNESYSPFEELDVILQRHSVSLGRSLEEDRDKESSLWPLPSERNLAVHDTHADLHPSPSIEDSHLNHDQPIEESHTPLTRLDGDKDHHLDLSDNVASPLRDPEPVTALSGGDTWVSAEEEQFQPAVSQLGMGEVWPFHPTQRQVSVSNVEVYEGEQHVTQHAASKIESENEWSGDDDEDEDNRDLEPEQRYGSLRPTPGPEDHEAHDDGEQIDRPHPVSHMSNEDEYLPRSARNTESEHQYRGFESQPRVQRPTTPVRSLSRLENHPESPHTVPDADNLFDDDNSEDEESDNVDHDVPSSYPEDLAGRHFEREDTPPLEAVPEHEPLNEFSDTYSAHQSSGMFANLVDTIRSDLPAVRQLQDVDGQAYHSEPEYSLGSALRPRSVSFEDPEPHYAQSYTPQHDSYLHIRTHTADTVPSFESYTQSDSIPTTPSDAASSPFRDGIHDEPMIQNSWPGNGISSSPPQALSTEIPKEAEFNSSLLDAYSAYISPKPSLTNLTRNEEEYEPFLQSNQQPILLGGAGFNPFGTQTGLEAHRAEISPLASWNPFGLSGRVDLSKISSGDDVKDRNPFTALTPTVKDSPGYDPHDLPNTSSPRQQLSNIRNATSTPSRLPLNAMPSPSFASHPFGSSPASATRSQHSSSPQLPPSPFPRLPRTSTPGERTPNSIANNSPESLFAKTLSLFESASPQGSPPLAPSPITALSAIHRSSATPPPLPRRSVRSRPSSLYLSKLPDDGQEEEKIELVPRSLDGNGKPPSPVFIPPTSRSGSVTSLRKEEDGPFIVKKSSSPFLGGLSRLVGGGFAGERGL